MRISRGYIWGYIHTRFHAAHCSHTASFAAIGFAGTVYSASQGDATGSFMGIAGIHLTAFEPFAKEAGWDIAKAVPVLGTALNVVATGRDLYLTVKDYQACIGGH